MVMKKTRGKHLLRTIHKNVISFFAVAFIAATSIAIFLGLQSAATAIMKASGQYFITNKLQTMEITCATGITAQTLDAVKEWDDIDIAEGGYSDMVVMDGEYEKITLQAFSLTEQLNNTVVLEGKLPTKPDEIAVEELFVMRKGIQIGDVITLAHDGNLVSDTFTVTAIINQPAFCCARIQDSRGQAKEGLGAASFYIAMTKDAFNSSYYGDRFTKVYIYNNELGSMDYYSEDYKSLETELIDKLEVLGTESAEHDKWLVNGRNDIGDVRAVEGIADGIFNISYSMSVIFLFVAIIVCHAAISRMIDEQRVLIGAQKALGFNFGEILRHYMLYNALSGILGIALGIFLGLVVVENLVLFVFAHEFVMGDIPLAFAWKEALLAAAICMTIFLVSTYTACGKLIRLPAIVLLKGEVPVQGKRYFFESWPAYRKLNLYSRTMIKNVLNDKSRIMTTVMGVVGCISLLLICFSLKLGIENSSVTQFDRYFLYENRLVIDSSVGKAADFEKILDEEQIPYTTVHDKLKFFRTSEEESWESGRIIAASDFEELKDFIYLEDIQTKDYAKLPTDGLLVSRKCAEIFDLDAGSEIEIMDSQGNPLTVKIAGIIEHYLPYHLFVTAKDYYEAALLEETDDCVILLNSSIEGLHDQVKDLDGFFSLKDNTEFAANADAHTGVIAVCFVLSAVMAVLVLLNQITMHINRKARELAVMRINGYTLKETKAYIYKENIVLTILGLIMGSGFGMFLSYIIITSVETGANRYVRTPNIFACIVACAIGALFTLLVNIYALRKVNHLNLTNVNGN